MKNLVSIFAGHDANVSFYNAKDDKYYTIEIERLVKKRYFRLHVDNDEQTIRDILFQCRNIAATEWDITNDFETVLVSSDGWINPPSIIREVFHTESVKTVARHHDTHAAAAFYKSPFDEALIISYDGGGDDGFFNVYYGGPDGIESFESIQADFGGAYLLCGSLIREVAEKSRH